MIGGEPPASGSEEALEPFTYEWKAKRLNAVFEKLPISEPPEGQIAAGISPRFLLPVFVRELARFGRPPKGSRSAQHIEEMLKYIKIKCQNLRGETRALQAMPQVWAGAILEIADLEIPKFGKLADEGAPKNHIAKIVAALAARHYLLLTGKRPTRYEHGGFIGFLREVYTALGLDISAGHYARNALEELEKTHPKS